MNRRETVLALLGLGAAVGPLSSLAEQHQKIWRIGYLSPGVRTPYVNSLVRGLRDLGYIEGQNIVLEYRGADGKQGRMKDLAVEIVRLKPDLIFSASTEAIQIVRSLDQNIPIVMAGISDPVGSELVTNLARPGGNITGMSLISTDLAGKRLQLLGEAAPGVRRVGLLALRDHSPTRLLVSEMQSAAKALKLEILPIEIAGPSEYENAFSLMARSHVDGLIVQSNILFNASIRAITDLATKHRLPSMGSVLEFGSAGGLLAYGPDLHDIFRRAASYADKIFKGAKAGDLSVEQPTKFELVINLRAAKFLRLVIPQSLLLRADKVIE